jgi:transcriptional regulator NrdR family protein
MARFAAADVPCPECGQRQSHVIDTGGTRSGVIRRRRACSCGKRFTTYEHLGRDPRYLVHRLFRIEALIEEIRDEIERPPTGM